MPGMEEIRRLQALRELPPQYEYGSIMHLQRAIGHTCSGCSKAFWANCFSTLLSSWRTKPSTGNTCSSTLLGPISRPDLVRRVLARVLDSRCHSSALSEEPCGFSTESEDTCNQLLIHSSTKTLHQNCSRWKCMPSSLFAHTEVG